MSHGISEEADSEPPLHEMYAVHLSINDRKKFFNLVRMVMDLIFAHKLAFKAGAQGHFITSNTIA
jgi:hypothetical protein